MKKYIFIVCFALISNTIWAQSASDYYLPVCKGNYLQFQTKTAYTGTDSGGWAFRKTHFSINNAAVFYGKTYFLEKGYEVLNNSPQDTSFFHRLWIREDANGNIMIGAFGMSNSDNPDSAFVLPMEGPIFTNAYLNKGYSISKPVSANVMLIDSVVNTDVTVGSYTECIQVRSTRKTNGIIDMIDDNYYAKNVGRVKSNRILPYYQVHEDELIGHLAVDCNPTSLKESNLHPKSLTVYPNPASKQIYIEMNHSAVDLHKIEIYNLYGQRVLSSEIVDLSQPIHIDQLSNGVYHYVMLSKNDMVFSGKISVYK
jgi:hypothetical protein